MFDYESELCLPYSFLTVFIYLIRRIEQERCNALLVTVSKSTGGSCDLGLYVRLLPQLYLRNDNHISTAQQQAEEEV